MFDTHSTSPINLGLCCTCSGSKFIGYYCNNECLGFFCQSCWKEWLLGEFVVVSCDQPVVYKGKEYACPMRSATTNIETSTEEVKLEHMAEFAKPGDHIMWQDIGMTWNHGIVEDVNREMITLIYFTENTAKRCIVDVTKMWHKAYKVAYDGLVQRYNPAVLSLARAKALVELNASGVEKKTNKSLARFCKLGISTCYQSWLHPIFGKMLLAFLQYARFNYCLVLFNACLLLMNMYYFIAFELSICIWRLGRLYQNYMEATKDRCKSLSGRRFLFEMVKQMFQTIFATLYGMSGGPAFTKLGTVTFTELNMTLRVLFGIVGGATGLTIGSAFGIAFGHLFAEAISKTVTTNELAAALQDLEPGDHITFYGNPFHPRCHAIVLETNLHERTVTVIRYTHESGVVLDTLALNKYGSIFKVMYPINAGTYSGDEIVERALKALVLYEKDYSFLQNNCGHFLYGLTLRSEVKVQTVHHTCNGAT